MTALNARLSAKARLLWYPFIACLFSVLCVFNPETVGAQKNKEEFGHLSLNEKWHGDFEGMSERRLVRALEADARHRDEHRRRSHVDL